jgi:PDZ domain-containing protein
VTVAVRRDGERIEERITLGERPDAPGVGYLGVSMAERADVPFEVAITLEDVGGPSAGMMFALGVIDKLTPGELTGGRVVAGTGTIDSQGAVGTIGGARYKVAAARDAGAEVFLVPRGNCTDAQLGRPGAMRLVPVDTLRDAVAALDAVAAGGEPAVCPAADGAGGSA